jgi:putative ABC transport system permease protein
MTILHRLAAMVAWVWRRDRAEQQLDAELHAYVEMSAAAKVREGLSLDEARRQARIELGGVEQVKEQVRHGRHGGVVDEVWRDVRFAVRLLANAPMFSAVIVVTLALGIGATTAIFSVVDALLLRSLPVRSPEELVQISLVDRNEPPNTPGGTVSYAILGLLAEQHDLFDGVGGFSAQRMNVGPPEAVVRVPGATVAGDFFGTLGLEAQAGRLLTAADDTPGAPAVVVLSDGYWQRQFGRSPQAIGQTLLIEGVAVPIVGVSPRGFAGATVGASADITIAAAARPQIDPESAPLLQPGNFWLRAIARPRAGVSRDEVTTRLAAVWREEAQRVLNPRWAASQRAAVAANVFRLVPGGTGWSYLRTIYRAPLLVLMAVVAAVLLIACANVACLLLARASARRHEMALRLALGAGRGRIVRQLLTEGLILAALGGALGTALAWAASAALVRFMATPQFPIDIDVAPNTRVLAFTALVAIATALVFAVAPALHATAIGPAAALSSGSRATRRRSRWLSALVSAQVAVSLVLLAGAGLFLRTLGNLQRVDAGFSADAVVLAELDFRRLTAGDLAGDVARLPGVAAASLATHTPLSGWLWSEAFVPAGQVLPERDTALAVGAGPDYFSALRIRILAGRAFSPSDDAGAVPVVIVNEAFARRFFPGQPVVGQRLSTTVFGVPHEVTVVGLVGNTRTKGLREAPPETVYLPFAQMKGRGGVTLVVRGQGSVAALTRAIEPAIRAAVPGTPIEILPFAGQVDATIVQERVLALLAAAFALLAMGLAIVGLYGVVAYGVTQRVPEIGVRLALGAGRVQVLGLVLADAAWLVGIGVALGVPAAWLATGWVRTLLFGVTPADPLTAVGAVATLTIAALIAACLPARRAARTDPLVALRQE